MNNLSQPIDEVGVAELLISTWQWQESRSLNMGGSDRLSPESEGFTEQRKFLSNGNVEFYKDWKLIGTYPYKVGPLRMFTKSTLIYELTIGEQSLMFKVSGDKLVIGNGGEFGYCGRDHYYTRISESTMNDLSSAAQLVIRKDE